MAVYINECFADCVVNKTGGPHEMSFFNHSEMRNYESHTNTWKDKDLFDQTFFKAAARSLFSATPFETSRKWFELNLCSFCLLSWQTQLVLALR